MHHDGRSFDFSLGKPRLPYQRKSQLFSMRVDIMFTKTTLIDPPAPHSTFRINKTGQVWGRPTLKVPALLKIKSYLGYGFFVIVCFKKFIFFLSICNIYENTYATTWLEARAGITAILNFGLLLRISCKKNQQQPDSGMEPDTSILAVAYANR